MDWGPVRMKSHVRSNDTVGIFQEFKRRQTLPRVCFASVMLIALLGLREWGARTMETPYHPQVQAQAEVPELFAHTEGVIGQDGVGESSLDAQFLAIKGDLIFWMISGRLALYDRAGNGEMLSEIPVGFRIDDIERLGDLLAIVPVNRNEILLFDIADTTDPIALEPIQTRQNIVHLAADGNLLFAISNFGDGAPYFGMLHRVDLTNPSQPALSLHAIPHMVEIRDLAAENGIVAIAFDRQEWASGDPVERMIGIFEMEPGQAPIQRQSLFLAPSGFVRLQMHLDRLLVSDQSGIDLYQMGADGLAHPLDPGPVPRSAWVALSGDGLVVARRITDDLRNEYRAESYDLSGEIPVQTSATIMFDVRSSWEQQGVVVEDGLVCETTWAQPPASPRCWDFDVPNAPSEISAAQRKFQFDKGRAPACLEHAAFFEDGVLVACQQYLIHMREVGSSRLEVVDYYRGMIRAANASNFQVADGQVYTLETITNLDGIAQEVRLLRVEALTHPLEFEHVTIPNEPRRLVSFLDHLIILRSGGLDVLDPNTQQIVGQLNGQGWGHPTVQVRFDGNRLWLRGADATGQAPPEEEAMGSGWDAIDLSQPDQPQLVYSDLYFIQPTGRTVLREFHGERAYTIVEDSPAPESATDIRLGVHDLSTPSVLIGTQSYLQDAPHRGFPKFAHAKSRDTLFLGLAGPFVSSFDISQPDLVDRHPYTAFEGKALSPIWDPEGRVIVDQSFGLEVVRADDAGRPERVARWMPTGDGVDTFPRVRNGRIDLAQEAVVPGGDTRRLSQVFDYRAGIQPPFSFNWPRPHEWTALGDWYFSNPQSGRSLQVHRFEAGKGLSLRGMYCHTADGRCPGSEDDPETSVGLVVAGKDRLFMVSGSSLRLLALDINNPARPQFLGDLSLTSHAYSIQYFPSIDRVVVGGLVPEPYLMLDVEDPANMRIGLTLNTEEYGTRFFVHEKIMVALQRRDVQLYQLAFYDMTNPDVPVLISTYPFGNIRWPRLSVAGRRATLQLQDEVRIVDFADPAAPQVVGRLLESQLSTMDLVDEERLLIRPDGIHRYGRLLGEAMPRTQPELPAPFVGEDIVPTIAPTLMVTPTATLSVTQAVPTPSPEPSATPTWTSTPTPVLTFTPPVSSTSSATATVPPSQTAVPTVRPTDTATIVPPTTPAPTPSSTSSPIATQIDPLTAIPTVTEPPTVVKTTEPPPRPVIFMPVMLKNR